MKLFEVKNNLVKIIFNETENLVLSGILTIDDKNQSYIAQVMHLEANKLGKIAIAKLLFNFSDDGVISNYDGSIPSISSNVNLIEFSEILGLFNKKNPICLGKLAQNSVDLVVDKSFGEENLLVISENNENSDIFIKNLSAQFKNSIIIDCDGDYESNNKIIATQDFKLPLNYDAINFIYEKGLEDASAETKAMLQEIFIEVQNYVKTLDEKFIPFDKFRNVVEEQYNVTKLVELVLLKNKLLKFYEEGIFANTKEEFEKLQEVLETQNTTVVDVSLINDILQRELIFYTISVIKELQKDFYVFVKLSNSNTDKKLLKHIFNAKNIHPIVICDYSFKYLNELKQIAKNIVMFEPIQQQQDFAGYNVFLNKLSDREFIVYGKSVQNIPLIVKLEEIDFPQTESFEPVLEPEKSEENIVEPIQTPEILPQDNALNVEDKIQQEYDAEETLETLETLEELPEAEIVTMDEERAEKNNVYQEDLFSLNPVEETVISADIEKSLNNAQEIISPTELNDIKTEDDALVELETELETVSVPEISEQTFENDSHLTEDDLDFIDENVDIENEKIEIIEDKIQIDEEINEEEPLIEINLGEEEIISKIEIKEDEEFEIIKPVETGEIKEEIATTEENKQKMPEEEILPQTPPTPIVPVFSADIPAEDLVPVAELSQGDNVYHAKYGKGVVEKVINYGSKKLCSIHFENVGRRLLDPSLSELKRV